MQGECRGHAAVYLRVIALLCPVAALDVPQASTLCWMRRDQSWMAVMSEVWPGGTNGHVAHGLHPFEECRGYVAVLLGVILGRT